ncbi:copper amine oxidase N-terminal domain-containing protein [Schinkia azotoformans]|uniref:copper amine oxidase N-terminal domain-containing protein n=1 Tax=Schinkia azotoformans TaxID=1454 RepID=UPI002DB5D278|nr:copper amine oxidase N-terminal domain-containing protein [Schinkia azotoformans]MEC1697768.1 copper amine oxidase N-terminal domain-containing protein [Schinkia azotoformans]
MKFKFIFSLILAATVLFLSNNAFALENNVKIEVNGNVLQMDQPPIVENDVTLVPLRGIFETLGAKVEWDAQTQSIKANKNDVQMELKVDSKVAKINNNNISLLVPAKVINGRTLVPLRFVSESLGADIKWNAEDRSISISMSNNDNEDSNNQSDTKTEDKKEQTTDVEKPELEINADPTLVIFEEAKAIGITVKNNSNESAEIKKVEVYEKGNLLTTYSASELEQGGLKTTIKPSETWGMSINYKIGIWANDSYVKVHVKHNNTTKELKDDLKIVIPK